MRILRTSSLDEPMTMNMLKTEMALSGPESPCAMYPSIEGLSESANLPMMGIVHVAPGRWAFLTR